MFLSYTSSLQIPALGRNAVIGELHDARTESFGVSTILRTALPPSFLNSRVTSQSKDARITNSKEERVNFKKIQAEIVVSVFSGVLEVGNYNL